MRQDLKLRILESLHVEALENSQFEILPHLVAPEWLAVPSPGFPRQISGSVQNQQVQYPLWALALLHELLEVGFLEIPNPPHFLLYLLLL